MTVKRTQVSHSLTPESGFTIIEVIVTLALVSLFVAVFFQTHVLLESQRLNVLRQAKASDIAFDNLSQYPFKPASLRCTADVIAAGSDGYTLSTTSTTVAPIGTNTQTVTAYAPNGCDMTDPDKFKYGIVKLVSRVRYGSNNTEVTHATFIR